MNVLVTAGNTLTPVDRVRCITNIFSGKTGAQIAARAFDRGHAVVHLTSHPEALAEFPSPRHRGEPDFRVRPYRTFDDLDAALGEELAADRFDAVVHAAAVSDYHVAGVFAPTGGTAFNPASLTWTGDPPRLVDTAAGKVKSSYPEVWLRLTPAPKLVDKIRPVWGFKGVLVKFKLEVGVSDAELLDIAERSRVHSGADLMAANTLEGRFDWAVLGAGVGSYRRIDRSELADQLLDAVEKLAAARG